MKRKLLIVFSLALIIGGVMLSKWMSANKKAPDSKEIPTSAKLVSTRTVANGNIATGISITGKLTARNKVELYSEVGGVLKRGSKEFKEGVAYRKGEVMLSIESAEQRMSVVSQRSALLRSLAQMIPDMRIDLPEHAPKWESFLNGIDIEKNLPRLPAVKDNKEKLFLSGRNILDQYYGIRSQEERLAKYTIVAPFDGILSSSMIDPGTNVRVGQPLGEFIQPDDLELEAAVNVSDAARIFEGQNVELWSNDLAGQWQGSIRRVSGSLDKSTQSIKVFVAISDKELKDGMYLRGTVNTDTITNAFDIPRKFLLAGDMVYTVNDSILSKEEVEVVTINEMTAVVRGLKDGTKVLDEQLAGAYEGMPVVTNGK